MTAEKPSAGAMHAGNAISLDIYGRETAPTLEAIRLRTATGYARIIDREAVAPAVRDLAQLYNLGAFGPHARIAARTLLAPYRPILEDVIDLWQSK